MNVFSKEKQLDESADLLDSRYETHDVRNRKGRDLQEGYDFIKIPAPP